MREQEMTSFAFWKVIDGSCLLSVESIDLLRKLDLSAWASEPVLEQSEGMTVQKGEFIKLQEPDAQAQASFF